MTPSKRRRKMSLKRSHDRRRTLLGLRIHHVPGAFYKKSWDEKKTY